MKKFFKLSDAIQDAKTKLRDLGTTVHTEKWQGMDITEKPEFRMWELLNYSFSATIPNDIEILKQEVKPNIPWAEDHFLERVAGEPINPGNEYKNWPSYKNKSNDKFRIEEEKFSHTYMERIWGNYASSEGKKGDILNHGIRYDYGDLGDVLDLLEKEPFTRQAFLPIWFPEDTGVKFGGRVPCTIGYHFIRRHNWLHVVYYIRSCDFLRHFRDDVYLCSRKVMWIIDRLKERDPEKWNNVVPGTITMHITSLHIFEGEKFLLTK